MTGILSTLVVTVIVTFCAFVVDLAEGVSPYEPFKEPDTTVGIISNHFQNSKPEIATDLREKVQRELNDVPNSDSTPIREGSR